MKFTPKKSDIPSITLLFVLVMLLLIIYVKPQAISSHLSSNENISHVIYSKNYQLELNADERKWLKDNPVLTLGIDRAFPPFGSISSDDKYVGFSADYIRTIENRLKVTFEFDKDATWNETMQLAEAGQLDVVAGLVNTPSRQDFLNFTKSYVSNPTIIINDAIHDGYIGSLKNLAGKKVAIEAGSYVHGELSRKYTNIELMPVKNTNLALSLVATDTADAYVGNAIAAGHLIKKFGYTHLSFSGETEFSSNHSIGVAKHNVILAGIMQKALASISPDSREAISNYWLGMEVEEKISAETIVKIVAAFCSVLLILLAWAFSLKKTKNDLKLSRQQLQKEANQDHLTGLGNRRKFYQSLAETIKKSRRAEDTFALLQLDLDDFKEINDNFGHSIGDLLIVETASRIKTCLSENDVVTRNNGGEFLIILAEAKNNTCIERLAKNILTNLSNTFYIEDNEIYTSASIGITQYPADAKTSEQLVNNVDQAMFHSKKLGKNRFTHFNFWMKNEIETRNNTIIDLRNAIKEEQFELHYQPIIDLKTNRVTKAEALIRWNHPTLGLVYPDKFIPLAEETGLIIEIGEWVFKQAVSETVKIKQMLGYDFQMSINTSPLQYGKNGMDISDWFSHIVTSGLSGKDITLEITENVLMQSSDTVRNKLYNLRDLDVKIAIDDFGTGYSSLSYLKEFEIDFLKIDRAFVEFLSKDSDDLVLIQAIIVMAHKLGFKVIAEGIENEEQRTILANEGCDFGQGYHFSKPICSSDFMKLLKNWEVSDEIADCIVNESNKEEDQILSFEEHCTKKNKTAALT